MKISGIITAVNTALDRAKNILQKIPGILLICTCTRRPGFSSILTSAKIYADMHYVQEEYDDVVKEFVFNVVNRIKMNIQDDGVCFIIIPPNELKVQLVGGNAGGPILLDGSNIGYAYMWGIIR